jgi:hypothetical protein
LAAIGLLALLWSVSNWYRGEKNLKLKESGRYLPVQSTPSFKSWPLVINSSEKRKQYFFFYVVKDDGISDCAQQKAHGFLM